MSLYDDYIKKIDESEAAANEAIDLSTKNQIDKLKAQKQQTEADKQTAYRGAYSDYAKNINPYGVQTESAYASGLGGAGKGETAQANYYNTYQNQLGTINTNAANQVRDYDTGINDATAAAQASKLSQQQANSQNAANALLTDAQMQESIRQYNESLALQKAQQDESVRQYNEQMAYQRQQDALTRAASSSDGGINNGKLVSINENGLTPAEQISQDIETQRNNLYVYTTDTAGNTIFDANPTGTFKTWARNYLNMNSGQLTQDEYNAIVGHFKLKPTEE